MSNAEHATLRVLVAEDDEGVLDAYRQILGALPAAGSGAASAELRARLFGENAPPASATLFEPELCRGAEAAVEAVRASLSGRRFAVAFLDMRMPPGPDGAWAAARIRELEPELDIVIATAYSDVDPRELGARVPPEDRLFYVQKPFHPHEVRQLALALGRRHQAERQIRQLAYFDTLTGLPNRPLFRARLEHALELARRKERALAVLFVDLDRFKRINDTLGHSAGDELLRTLAARLRTCVRASDSVTRPGGAGIVDGLGQPEGLARLGGDEFTVLLSEIADAKDAGFVAQRLLDALSQPVRVAGHELVVSASIGIAVFPRDGGDAESLIRNADLAMYFAKSAGRNTSRFYDASMNERALQRLTIETHLRDAIARGELALHYQPQLELGTGAIGGVEALSRWSSAELGPVPPSVFVPIAEETGLIIAIGEATLRSACAQAKAWRDAGIRMPRMAVNVSMLQLEHPGFLDQVARALAESGLEPSVLELEVTESLITQEGGRVADILRGLKTLGVQIAIDDFGTGYSNLARLKEFPIDCLKIDRAFVCGIDREGEDRAIAKAVIALGENLKLRVLAEGVETDAQLAQLKELRCGEAQGYLWAKPLPAVEAEAFLRRAMQRGSSE